MPAPEPSVKSIPLKLGLKPAFRVLVQDAPVHLFALMQPMPEGATLSTSGDGPFDAVLVFSRNKADASAHSDGAVAALRPGGLIWMAYPKKSGKDAVTDLSRDAGWDALTALGWRVVALVALDENWSALRFRPLSEVKRSKGGA